MTTQRAPAKKAKKEKVEYANPRDRFEKVGAARVARAIVAIRAISKMAGSKNYEYTESDVGKLKVALDKEIVTATDRMIATLRGTAKRAPGVTFSFDN